MASAAVKQQWEESSVWTITLKYNVPTYLLADAQLDEVAYKAEYSKKISRLEILSSKVFSDANCGWMEDRTQEKKL